MKPPELAPGRLLDLYYYMRLTRSLEERLVNLKRQGRISCGIYRSLGQEGESVGAASALDRSRDVLCPLIRNLGALLVQGGTPLEVLRQMMARETSPTRGRELGFHYADLSRGFIGHIACLGDMLPVMAGVALSFRVRHEPRVAMVFSGDGATSTGAFHEGLNFGAVQRLPLVVVVEHNGYAYSTPPRHQYAVERLADRALAYGVPAVTVDGNDVLAVYHAARQAVERARSGGGVSLIEVRTYRRTGHAEHDDQRYVPPGEVAEWESRDPLGRFARWLLDNGSHSAADLELADARVTAELDAAVTRCEAEPEVPPAAAFGNVYAQARPAGAP